MNLDELIYDFYEKRLEMEISSVAADLYFFLLREMGKKETDTFFESTDRICMWLKIDKRAFIKARKELQKFGFISFVAGTGRNRPQYSIIEHCVSGCKNVPPNDTPNVSGCKNVPPNDTPNVSGCKNVPPNENKLKEKKEENPPIPPKEEIKIKNNLYTRAQKNPIKTRDELIANMEKRKRKFYDSLIPFLQTYGKQMLREFFDYWSEPNKSQTKMRFEQQPTWALNLRLARWANNNNKYTKNNGTYQQDNGRAEREAAVEKRIRELLSETDATSEAERRANAIIEASVHRKHIWGG